MLKMRFASYNPRKPNKVTNLDLLLLCTFICRCHRPFNFFVCFRRLIDKDERWQMIYILVLIASLRTNVIIPHQGFIAMLLPRMQFHLSSKPAEITMNMQYLSSHQQSLKKVFCPKHAKNVDRKSRYHQCSSESPELSTRYVWPSSVVCSFRVVTCSLCGVCHMTTKVDCRPGESVPASVQRWIFFRNPDGLCYAASEAVLFFAFDCDGFRSKTVIMAIHIHAFPISVHFR